MMQIIKRILHCQIIPVARAWHGLIKITVLHGNDVGIEKLGQFLYISLMQRIIGIIAFCNKYCWTVKTAMTEHYSLLKLTSLRVLSI